MGGDVPNTDIEQLSIDTIRTLSMDAVQQANAGHPGTAMALAPLAYLLYTETMRHSPSNPHWPNRDRFVLSAGHACILQYTTLHLTGYNLSLEELRRFRQWQSATPGHPEYRHTPGVETTTGPLGQGFANGIGFAIAERFLADTFNRPHHTIVDHRVYAICSDGDLMEGVSYEAGSLAGTNGLGKLIYFYDDNRITIDGTTSISFTAEDRGRRFEAQGWHVQWVDDANDLTLLRKVIENAQSETERPSLVVVRSHIGFGAPHAVDTAKAHGAPLGEEEVRATKEALGWDPDEHFVVPDEVRKYALGHYGELAAPIAPNVLDRIVRGQQPITARPGELLAPGVERVRRERGPFESDDDLLLAAFYDPVQYDALVAARPIITSQGTGQFCLTNARGA